MLTIAFLMTMPTYVQVHAVTQGSQKTSWSPYGPATPNLIIHDYSAFPAMFTAFQNGQVDITDWPVQAPDLTTFCGNVDIWCSSPDPELGIFQLDVNNHAPFLGAVMEAARPSLTGSVASVVSGSSSACSNGFGQVTLNVVNVENGTQVYKDPLNTVTIANQPSGIPSATVNDQGAATTPTGTYVFPCIIAGSYLLSGSMISGNSTSGSHLGCGVAVGCLVTVPPGTAPNGGTVSATWNVVWNSPSTLISTAAHDNIMKAISHLVNKHELVLHDTTLQGHAACDDINLAPAHGIQGSPCVLADAPPGSPFPASVLTRECVNLVPDAFVTCDSTHVPVSAYNLADANFGASHQWWSVPGLTGPAGAVASGYASPADIDAACQYLSKVFTLTSGTCADLANVSQLATQPSSYGHFTPLVANTHLGVFLRTDPPRGDFGQIIADSLNFLFNTPNDSGSCTAPCGLSSTGTATIIYENPSKTFQITHTYIHIGPAIPVVFEDGSPAKYDGWNMYTGGFSLGSTPDFLFANFHSEFASTACGGSFNDFPSNYNLHCDPQFDALSNAGEFLPSPNPTLTLAASIFTEAAVRFYDSPNNDPMYSRKQQFAELNGWNWQQSSNPLSSSLVIQKGHGTQTGFWSLLNARQLPGYTPTNTIYTPGGGNPNLIRRGFSQDPDTLNPYQALTVWDFEILSQVFDSLLNVNPATAGQGQQVIDWMTTNHFATFNPNEIGCIPPPSVSAPSCFKGITTQTWHLRNDLFFHDGTPVTAQDVVYSILTSRDDPSGLLFSSVAFVTNAVALDSKTVQVKLESNSAFYELNIGGIPIIPQHLWQGPAGDICGSISSVSTPAGPENAVLNGPASACADPNFDPFTCTGTAGLVTGCGTSFTDGSFQGILVGSGDYECLNVATSTQAFGKPGGTCAESSTGSPISSLSFTVDSRALLTGNSNYMRGLRGGQGNSLQKESWADFNNDGVVNILDASNAAFFFGATNPYWAHPQYSCTSTATQVDVCDISALLVFFDEGTTAPFGGNNVNPSTALQILDPQINPYSLPLTASTCLYYQSTTTSKTLLQLINCGTSAGSTLPAGHTITDSASVLNSDGTLGTTQSGSVTVSGGTVTNSWSPGLVSGTHYVVKIFDNGAQIGLFFVTA